MLTLYQFLLLKTVLAKSSFEDFVFTRLVLEHADRATLVVNSQTQINGRNTLSSTMADSISRNHTLGFHLQLKSENHLVQHNKQHHGKVLLSSFHLNGHTLGFHPQTQKLESPCTAR